MEGNLFTEGNSVACNPKSISDRTIYPSKIRQVFLQGWTLNFTKYFPFYSTSYFMLILSMNFCFVVLRWTPTLPQRIHFHKNLNMNVTLNTGHFKHGFAKAHLSHVFLILLF